MSPSLLWRVFPYRETPPHASEDGSAPWRYHYNRLAHSYNTWTSIILVGGLISMISELDEEIQSIGEKIELTSQNAHTQAAKDRFDYLQKNLSQLQQKLDHLQQQNAKDETPDY